MPLKINNSATLFSLTGGEAFDFEYQPVDGDGVPEDLTGTSWQWFVIDAQGTQLDRKFGQVLSDETGHFVRWKNTGLVSERYYGSGLLRWLLIRNADDGYEEALSGQLNINPGVAGWYDKNDAPTSRFITRITHYYDPTRDSVPAPIVKPRRVLPSTPVVTPGGAFDFSDPANSGYIGLV